MKCDHHNGTGCSLGLFGGDPSEGVCRICDRYSGPARGAGDVVHRIAETTGVGKLVRKFEAMTGKPCGCAERRAALNAAMPFSDEPKKDTPCL